jgi:hypothetical protein
LEGTVSSTSECFKPNVTDEQQLIVPWKEFFPKFLKLFCDTPCDEFSKNYTMQSQCLEVLLCKSPLFFSMLIQLIGKSLKNKVHIRNFSLLLFWFGPMAVTKQTLIEDVSIHLIHCILN